MPCFRPLTAWRGALQPSGKRAVVFKRGDADPALSLFTDHLPCGQCFGCRLDYSCDWAMRCDKETQMHKQNCFITLTYDDAHVPANGLQLDDWQRFMKRLRREVGHVRFFHAGEYGEKFGRPHDHALLFGYDFPDRLPLKRTAAGKIIYSSETLSRLWGNGYCSVGEATFESAAYLARYCMKKISGKAKDCPGADGLRPYERLSDYGEVVDIRPEYVTMSRAPGIARDWFRKFQSDVFPHDYVVVRGGAKMPPPKAFDRWYELVAPEDFKRVKAERMARCSKKEEVWNEVLQKMQFLDCARSERLEVMEEWLKSKHRSKTKSLEGGI